MRSSWLGLGLLVAVTLAVRGHHQASPPPRPSVAFFQDRFIAVWRAGNDVVMQSAGKAPQVVYSHEHLAGEPSIFDFGQRMLISTARIDSKRAWRDEVIRIVDLGGEWVTGWRTVRHSVSADIHCELSGWYSFGISAIAGRRDDGRYGVAITIYDGRGDIVVRTVTSAGSVRPEECALTYNNNELALAVRSEREVVVTVYDVPTLKRSDPAYVLPAGGGAPWHVSITTENDFGRRYVVLHRDYKNKLRATEMDRRGIHGSTVLRADVDGATADIAENSNGVFVAWRAGASVHVRQVNGGPDHIAPVAAGSSLRATGYWDHCGIVARGTAPSMQFLDVVDCP